MLRPATRADARALAELADMAGEGLPGHLWAASAAPGEGALDVGTRRAQRDEGAFSWRNAVVAEAEGRVAAALVAYRIADAPAPLDGLPEAFRNLQALENLALSTHYVNILAVHPDYRRRGLARALLDDAETGAGPAGVSIIVADRNHAALRLYLSQGYAEAARKPIVRPAGWHNDSTDWVLLRKRRAGG